MSVTIKDVARRAGFSVATVSRVLNNKDDAVRPETRRRVEEAAAELGYTPNRAARSLITRKTHAFGVILPDLHGEFFSEVIRGIERTAQQEGYHLLVSSSHSHRDEIEAAVQAMHGRIDGLVIMSPGIPARDLLPALPASLPCVLLNCDTDGAACPGVNIDNYGGARGMVRHLLAGGHRRIAIIKGEPGNHDARERLRGYRDALAEAGVAADPALEAEGDFGEAAGGRAVRTLLELTERPTAIFAANDSMAIGALSALRLAGVEVPGDMAVAGFDDIPIARYASPPLSSVHVPIQELGAAAVTRLLAAIGGDGDGGGPGPAGPAILPTQLVVRASSGGRPGRPTSNPQEVGNDG